MSESSLNIDERDHKHVPSTAEQLQNAVLAIFLGFLLVNMIGFWLFPGVGLGGLYMFSNVHSMVAFIGDLTNVVVVAFLAICGVYGWFQGTYFIDRLKGYLNFWKFW